MTAVNVDCRVVRRLLGRWQDGELDASDAERLEEHLLLCPPCMIDNRCFRAALVALARAASPVRVSLEAQLGAELLSREEHLP